MRALLIEVEQLPRRMGGASGVLIFVIALVALGVLLPWRLGRDFMDIQVWLAYASLSMLVLGPVVAESVAGDRERASLPADAAAQRNLLVARVAAGALYGWTFTLLILAMGAATVRLSTGDSASPPAVISIDLAVLSLSLSLFAASAAAAVSMGARSVQHAKRTLRQAFLLLLVIVIYYSRFMPRGWKQRLAAPSTASSFTEGALVISVTLLVLAAGLLKLAMGRTQDTDIRLNL
jgi:hypothetical protein